MNTFKVAVVALSLLASSIVAAGGTQSTNKEHQSMSYLAQTDIGCCKKRDVRTRKWRKTGLEYKRCVRLNKSIDDVNDKITKPEGIIWWDKNCI